MTVALRRVTSPPATMTTAGALAIVAAGREELAALSRSAIIDGRFSLEGRRVQIGSLFGRPVTLMATGEGRAHAERGLRSLVERVRIDELLIVGFAGGLSPDLPAGAAVVAERVLDGSRPVAEPRRAWIDRALRSSAVRTATFVSAPRMLCDVDSKRRALPTTGLLPRRPAVVDLETAVLACVAAEYHIPYAAIRVVSDGFDEDLPLDFNRFIDRGGAVRRGR